MDDIKKITIKEFREKGYLQEVNRKFLHPLGLALEVIVDENGDEFLGGIWDYRDSDVGIYYDIQNSDDERKNRFFKNYTNIVDELAEKFKNRVDKLGFAIEPIIDENGNIISPKSYVNY